MRGHRQYCKLAISIFAIIALNSLFNVVLTKAWDKSEGIKNKPCCVGHNTSWSVCFLLGRHHNLIVHSVNRYALMGCIRAVKMQILTCLARILSNKDIICTSSPQAGHPSLLAPQVVTQKIKKDNCNIHSFTDTYELEK